jgi:branched-chain amino acid transport system ATP-binding protein
MSSVTEQQPDSSAAPVGEYLLEVENVVARYGSTTAIRGVSMCVRPGEIVSLLGANGAGKTTTLKTIVGLLRCAEGRIVFDGDDITSVPTERIVRRGLTLTPEGREVFGRLTVEENLRMGAGFAKHAVYEQRRDEIYELFPILHEKREIYSALLSGGQQQQLAIGRSLMSDPKLLLLDEPSLGLAPIVVEQVFDLIVKLRDQGRTVILAEQNADKALQIADRAYVLNTGRVELEGDADELRQNPEVEEAYLGLGASESA